MLIGDLPANAAVVAPHVPAFERLDERLTYYELDRWSESLARVIRGLSLSGTHGAVVIDNRLEYPVAYFAVARAEGVVVPTPSTLPRRRLHAESELCDVGYFLTVDEHVQAVIEAAEATPTARAVIVVGDRGRTARVAWQRRGPTQPRREAVSEHDVAVLLATSGTTSEPKRVALTHAALLADARAFLDLAELSREDRALIVLPFTASGTNTVELLAYVLSSVPAVLYPQPVLVLSEHVRLLEQHAITVINVTPFILHMWLLRSAAIEPRVRKVRKVFFSSAPIAPERLARLRRDFPSTRFYNGYGLTEAGPRCTGLSPEDADRRWGSVGRPLRGIEMHAVDAAGRRLAPGRVGELVVRGPNVMSGYYKRPDTTATVLRAGLLYTGDLGHVDEDGFVYVRGRKKNLVITRGISVSPEEVEEALEAHPDVLDARVEGQPDELEGERIVAHVVLRPEASISTIELREFLSVWLEPAKLPRQIHRVGHLERSAHHKIVRGRTPATGGSSQIGRDS